MIEPAIVWDTIEHKLASKAKLLPLNQAAFEKGLAIGEEARVMLGRTAEDPRRERHPGPGRQSRKLGREGQPLRPGHLQRPRQDHSRIDVHPLGRKRQARDHRRQEQRVRSLGL